MNPASPTVFIVDDDASIQRSLSRLLRQADYEPQAFSSAEEFLAARTSPMLSPTCLLLDLSMPGLGGLELQRELAAAPAACPVIFLSGNGSIPSTVQAMKQGAVTFLTKPCDESDLLQAISEAVETHRKALDATIHEHEVRRLVASLTEREREVMAWVIAGALNKQIASHLGIAEKTVKVHRGHVMGKMRVTSVADLVRLCAAAGFEAAEG